MKQIHLKYFIITIVKNYIMNIGELEKIDSRKMFQIYDNCYENAKESFEQNFPIPNLYLP